MKNNLLWSRLLLAFCIFEALTKLVSAVDNLVISGKLAEMGNEFDGGKAKEMLISYGQRYQFILLTAAFFMLGAMVLMVVWQYRMYQNTRLIEGTTKYRQYWIIVSWLIPIVGPFIPMTMLNESVYAYGDALRKVKGGMGLRFGSRTVLAFAWGWWLFTAFSKFFFIFLSSDTRSVQEMIDYFYYTGLNGLLGTGALVVFVFAILLMSKMESKVLQAVAEGKLETAKDRAESEGQTGRTEAWYKPDAGDDQGAPEKTAFDA